MGNAEKVTDNVNHRENMGNAEKVMDNVTLCDNLTLRTHRESVTQTVVSGEYNMMLGEKGTQ